MKPWTSDQIAALKADIDRLRSAAPKRLTEPEDGHIPLAKARKVAPFLWVRRANASVWTWARPGSSPPASSQNEWRRPKYHEIDAINLATKARAPVHHDDRRHISDYASNQYINAKRPRTGWLATRWAEFLCALEPRQ